eukprot:m51a1_g6858 hypothetical protein (437) ;mRNA; f:127560-131610
MRPSPVALLRALRAAVPREGETAGALEALRARALPRGERHYVIDAGGPRAITEALRQVRLSERVFEAALSAVVAVSAPAASAASRRELKELAIEVLDASDNGIPVRRELPSMRMMCLLCDAVTHLLLEAEVRLSIADEMRSNTLCAILGRSPPPETVQLFVRLWGPRFVAGALRVGMAGDGIAACAGSACRVLECLSRSEGVDAIALPAAERRPIARWVLALASRIVQAAEAAELQQRRLGGHLVATLRSAVTTVSNLVVRGGAGEKRVALARGHFALAVSQCAGRLDGPTAQVACRALVEAASRPGLGFGSRQRARGVEAAATILRHHNADRDTVAEALAALRALAVAHSDGGDSELSDGADRRGPAGGGDTELGQMLCAPELSGLVSTAAAMHRGLPHVASLAGDLVARIWCERCAPVTTAAQLVPCHSKSRRW